MGAELIRSHFDAMRESHLGIEATPSQIQRAKEKLAAEELKVLMKEAEYLNKVLEKEEV